jgi:carboxyl-terminal processing protease
MKLLNALRGWQMAVMSLKNCYRAGVLILVLAVVSPLSAEAAENVNNKLNVPSSRTLAKMVYTGQFEEASRELTTQPAVLVNQPTDPMRDKLNRFCTLLDQRNEVRNDVYQENVAESKKYSAKGDLEKALTSARKARFYADDPKTFGDQPWVKNLAAENKKLADNYLAKHEWLKAGNIYAELSTIYEGDKTYEKQTRNIAQRVRFEAMYKPKSDWADQLEDIKIDVIPEVSVQVAHYYVEKPDFAKMVTQALENLDIATEVPKLSETFPTLGEKIKSDKFNAEIKKLEAQVKAESKDKNFSTREFWQAFVKLMVINDETCDLPRNMMIREFMDAAMGELDPFTNVIWPADLKEFDKHTMGRFSGVGIQISMENGKIKVVTPIPGSPAYRAGIVPGDLITTIDGESTESITVDQAVRKITGPKGTNVTLGILHPWNQKTRQVALTRDTIVIQTVKGYKMDGENNWQYFIDPANKIAYVRITSFTDSTPQELTDALETITRQGGRGLILDLRFNPGGTLKAAVETVDLFIDKGVIVSTRGRSVEPWQKSASPSDTKFRDLPIIVLINNYSASAAEIVSGALKDYHRAWLIGERSFGKGSVQNVLPSSDDSYKLKITTAHYYLPSGKCIHRKPDSKEWGVDPNLKLELTPNEIKDVIDLQRDAEIVTQVNGVKIDSLPATTASTSTATATSNDADDADSVKPRKYPPNDIQLEASVAVMQARLTLNVPWETITTTRPAMVVWNHEKQNPLEK